MNSRALSWCLLGGLLWAVACQPVQAAPVLVIGAGGSDAGACKAPAAFTGAHVDSFNTCTVGSTTSPGVTFTHGAGTVLLGIFGVEPVIPGPPHFCGRDVVANINETVTPVDDLNINFGIPQAGVLFNLDTVLPSPGDFTIEPVINGVPCATNEITGVSNVSNADNFYGFETPTDAISGVEIFSLTTDPILGTHASEVAIDNLESFSVPELNPGAMVTPLAVLGSVLAIMLDRRRRTP